MKKRPSVSLSRLTPNWIEITEARAARRVERHCQMALLACIRTGAKPQKIRAARGDLALARADASPCRGKK